VKELKQVAPIHVSSELLFIMNSARLLPSFDVVPNANAGQGRGRCMPDYPYYECA
jgi:hypothetical protein